MLDLGEMRMRNHLILNNMLLWEVSTLKRYAALKIHALDY